MLDTIAVDLTPLLPGGENGGAKIFVLELLRGLFEQAPDTSFVLLTQWRTHEELTPLDGPNVRRVLVLEPTVGNAVQAPLRRIAARFFPRLPRRLRAAVSTVAYRLNNALKRSGSSSIVRQVRADLLFCPFTAPIYFEPGVPTVCTIYDLQYKTHPSFFAPEVVANRDRTFVDACRKATALAAISDYSRTAVLAHSAFDPARIRTIHLRMARRVVERPGLQDDAVLVRLGLVAGRYVIYPANFWQHKNHEMLFTAFGMACRGTLEADLKLVCTGAPGERMTWLQHAVARLGLRERVAFPGFVDHQDLAILVGHSAGMVFPSLYEGFGLPVIEAMAAGIPVACSDGTSLPEVAGDAAVFFDPRVPSQIAAALGALVGDPSLRTGLVAAGRRRAEKFSDSSRMVSEYLDLFRFAVDRAPRADSSP